ncbi:MULTISPECIES: hypothetical protein [unclassified Microcoleus]|uniref:hypothetical protein n=1 Tax=unclassified Microcoleus TaxID=2642155 RepID=UPI002FD315BB
MPSGEHRVGSTGASLLLGYSKEYFSRLAFKAPKQLKALQGEGFQGCLVETLTERDDRRGASKIKTLSKTDFKVWVEYEATKGNKHALALMAASFSEVLDDRFVAAFGHTPIADKDKLEKFDVDYGAYLEREELYRELREELEALELPGDKLYYPFLEPLATGHYSSYAEDPDCYQAQSI